MNLEKLYVRITRQFADKGRLYPLSMIDKNRVEDKERFYSIYYYNADQYSVFLDKGSVKGITDVITNKIVFDFDFEENPDVARKDTISLINRLHADHQVRVEDIEIYFSGNKGFGVILNLDKFITPKEHEQIANKLAEGLKTFDTSLYDATQILRVPNTKHKTSGLYKIPLTYEELVNNTAEQIRIMALNPKKIKEEYNKVSIEIATAPKPETKSETKEPSKEFIAGGELPLSINDPVLLNRPTNWKDYKWSLLQGNFNPKERHQAMMILAATCRGMGYDQELTTAMLQSADKKHCELTGDSEIDDLENNIIPSVFSENWNGGQYTYKNNLWLQQYVKRLGVNENAETENPTMEINDAFDLFKDYAKNIDELTIRTGIEELDKNVRLTIGMVVGIVAGPGTGKTSLSLQILNTMSKDNQLSVFASYDMYHSLVFQKLVQKHFKIASEDIFDRFKMDDVKFEAKVKETLKEEYGNVEFCFQSGQNPEEIIKTIKYAEEKTGKKCRLLVVDYNELVQTDISDATQSSAYVINKLREIANTMNMCVVVLMQPNKMTGTPADEIKSYRSAKGSSALEQAVAVMLGVSRPGYNPKKPHNDKFLTINALKNRMGSLFSIDLAWEGLTGTVSSLTDEQRRHLKQVIEENLLDKIEEQEMKKGKFKRDDEWN